MRLTVLTIAVALFFTACKKEVSSTQNSSASKTAQKDSTVMASKEHDSASSNEAKIETFDFVTELCTNKGYFDSNTYSRKEIEGTYQLWFNSTAFDVSTPSVFKPDDLYKVRREKDLILAKLDSDYSKNKIALENLIVVNTPYWQNIKKAHLAELKQDYEKNKLQITAYSNPSVLLNNFFTKKLSELCQSPKWFQRRNHGGMAETS